VSDGSCIFFYHGCNWSDIPARQQYLMGAIAKYLPIVYFDGGFDRPYRVTFQQPRPNITVVRGLTAMCQRFRDRRMEKVAKVFCAWRLAKLRKRYKRVIFWCAENWLQPFRYIRHDALVYDCIDPCFNEDPKRIEIFAKREIQVMSQSAQVFATADTLADFCRQHHRNVMLLNNACEPADYADDLLQTAPVPTWWPQTRGPIAAYLGSLDWRFDFAAVKQACVEFPGVHFILAGNVLPHLKPQVDQLGAMPNVTCPGRISVSDGRYLLSRCTIGLIPFTLGPMNDAINPVKMYAYALLGKPMAATAVRELVSRPQIVATAAPEHFGNAVSCALAAAARPETAAALKSFAAANTWETRAAQAWDAIKNLC
jgi:glycosyltransferase involved in cell wall biosynthesis